MENMMTKKIFKLTTFCCVLLFTFSIHADVFSIFSGLKKQDNKGAKASAELNKALTSKSMPIEPVVINGVKLSLGVDFIKYNLKTCIRHLLQLYPKASFSKNKNSVLAEVKLKNGIRKRIYLVELGGRFPVIQFSMELPAKLPKNFTWPRQLPLPSSATPITYMHFPKRKSYYGHFSEVQSVSQCLKNIASSVAAQGWRPLTQEGVTTSTKGNGEIFMKTNPLSMMIVTFTEGKDGKVKGSIYTRNLKK